MSRLPPVHLLVNRGLFLYPYGRREGQICTTTKNGSWTTTCSSWTTRKENVQMYNSFYPGPIPTRVVRVNGRPGAEAYQMAANSEALLLDETQPVVWLKTTDGAGYPRLTAYDITVHEDEKPVDYRSFEERLKRLEARFDAQSDAVTA